MKELIYNRPYNYTVEVFLKDIVVRLQLGAEEKARTASMQDLEEIPAKEVEGTAQGEEVESKIVSTMEGEEDDETEVAPTKKGRHRKKQLYQDLRAQMEFYFSDSNLTKDRFMGQLLQKSPEIDIAVFLKFNKIRTMTSKMKDIAKALKHSELLSVNEDGTKVFRVIPFKPKDNVDDCTIYVEQLPPDATHEWLKEVFMRYGKVAYTSIPKYKNYKIKGFGFVEFDTPAEAYKTLEAFGAMGCRLSSNMAPEKLHSSSAFEEPILDEQNRVHRKTYFDKQARDKLQTSVIDKAGVKLDKLLDVEENKNERKSEKNSKHMKENKGEEESLKVVDIQGGKLDEKKKKKRKADAEEDGSGKAHESPSNEEIYSIKETEIADKDKSKKRKKQDDALGEDIENNEGKEFVASVNTTTDVKKKKRKHDVNEEAKNEELLEDVHNGDIPLKKARLESIKTETDTEEGLVEKKKKRGKKTKKKKGKEKEEANALGLKVLSKREWKRLRNKYLELQRTTMRSLKQQLVRTNRLSQQVGRYNTTNTPSANLDTLTINTGATSKPVPEARFKYMPGVIVRIKLDSPVTEVKDFKNEAKSCPAVVYVDVSSGSCEAYLRCMSSEAATKLVQDKPWNNIDILQGEEEKSYWDKITKDRKEKFRGNIKSKLRGRDKLIKRAEKALGKHIKLEDIM
uniref:La-related protein 7 n=1 Tax=Timema genevievae TaxID=629358 RepID=A0A7R9JPJ3_TIMGE|nr:unnamed protein product [Timema genevievae]